MFTSVLRSPDSDGGGTAATATATATGDGARATVAGTDAPLPVGYKGCPDLRKRYTGGIGHGPLSTADVRSMMADVCGFLWQVAMITSGVLATVDVGKLRELVAADVSIPAYVIDEMGKLIPTERAPKVEAEQASKGEQAPDRDHRKNPRGRRHPLVALLIMGIQASRLLSQITQGTNPDAHDREPVQDRLDRVANEREDRESAREPYNDFGR